MLATLFLFSTMLATSNMSVQAASQSIIDDSADGLTVATNRMLGGIISYVRWPQEQGPAGYVFCVVGKPSLTARLDPAIPGRNTAISIVRTTAMAAIARGDCDIIYLGQMDNNDRQRIIAWVHRRPVLTIRDADPSCLYGAMFCLARNPAGLGFSINLDAIGRSPLHVDPRVLRIGQTQRGPV